MTTETKVIHGKVIATHDGKEGPLAVFQIMTAPEGVAGFHASNSGGGYEVTLPNQEKLEAGARASVVVGDFGSLALRTSHVNGVNTPGYVEPTVHLRAFYPNPIGDQRPNGGFVAPRMGAQSSRRT